jgi:ribosomal protein S27AE
MRATLPTHEPHRDLADAPACPRCGLTVRARHHWLAIDFCPRCLALAHLHVPLASAAARQTVPAGLLEITGRGSAGHAGRSRALR